MKGAKMKIEISDKTINLFEEYKKAHKAFGSLNSGGEPSSFSYLEAYARLSRKVSSCASVLAMSFALDVEVSKE